MSAGEQARRVVVVGATGNIGTSVVEALNADPQVDAVIALSRREPAVTGPKTRWERTDILRDELVDRFASADAVIHLAWLFQPTHDPVTTWRTNVVGSLRVFEAAAVAGVRTLVHASSIAAYGPGPAQEPIDEHWPTHGWPAAAYSREKAYLERCLDTFEYQHPEIRVVRMRPAFSFKAQSATQQRRLFLGPLLTNRLIRPDLLPALPTLSGMRFQAAHSDDVGEAYRLATRVSRSGAFNIAAGPVIDAEVLAELFGKRTLAVPAGPVRAALTAAWQLHLVPASPGLFDTFLRLPIMDTSRARNELGWVPRHTATDAVEEFLRGLREATGAERRTPLRSRKSGRDWAVVTGLGHRA